MVAVPAVAVAEVARDCGTAGVRALLVISAGFAETGPDGARRQQQLLAICRDAGMRLIGPNCFGLLNTADEIRLEATFAAHAPPPGNVAFLSQSGGLGIAVIEAAGRLGIGIRVSASKPIVAVKSGRSPPEPARPPRTPGPSSRPRT